MFGRERFVFPFPPALATSTEQTATKAKTNAVANAALHLLRNIDIPLMVLFVNESKGDAAHLRTGRAEIKKFRVVRVELRSKRPENFSQGKKQLYLNPPRIDNMAPKTLLIISFVQIFSISQFFGCLLVIR